MAEVGIAIPNLPGVTPTLIPDYARRIEAGGFAAIWALDRLVYDNVDAVATLAACAAVTQRVKLGTSIILVPLYPPAILAKQFASIDVLSNGRVIMGVGIGRRPDDFAAAGVPMERRAGRTVEALRIMRQIWAGAPLAFQGKHFTLESGPIGPRPIQRPGIPIWMGGAHEGAVRRAARYGDGYIAGGAVGPEGFKGLRQRVEQARQEQGRSGPYPYGCLAYFYIDDDREKAKQGAMAALTRYYGPAFGQSYDPERLLVFGPPDEFARRAQAYIDAGVEHLILVPTALDAGQVDRIAHDVLPRLRLR
jgi:probable F420-dependent oxidoreductase